MDITLERILSLIPRKPDGKYVHGAKATFARELGFKGGETISQWEAGSNNSYRNYLYEISEKYNVSVEWLKGESDIKEKQPTDNGELSEDEAALVELFNSAPEWKKKAALALLRAAEED